MPDFILEARGVSAWIEVGGTKLECYGSGTYRTQYTDNTSCWVASKESQKFAVRFAKNTRTFACVANLYLDGKWMAKRMFKAHESAEFSFHEKRTSEYKYLPYVFCSQSVVDDDALLDHNLLEGPVDANAENIGEITIKVERITDIIYKPPPQRRRQRESGGSGNESGLPPIQRIHETSMKAKRPPHQISLGEGAKQELDAAEFGGGGNGGFGGGGGEGYRGGRETMRPSYAVREVIATFTFRYRPMEILIENGIVTSSGASTAAAGTNAVIKALEADEEDEGMYAFDSPEDQEHHGAGTSYTTPNRNRVWVRNTDGHDQDHDQHHHQPPPQPQFRAHNQTQQAHDQQGNRALSWLNMPARDHATPTTTILHNAALQQQQYASRSRLPMVKLQEECDADEFDEEDEFDELYEVEDVRGVPVKAEVPEVIEVKDEEELEMLSRLQQIGSRKRKAPETPLKGTTRKASRVGTSGDMNMPPPPFFPPGVEVIDLT